MRAMLAALACLLCAQTAPAAVGYQTLVLQDDASRPLPVAVWYPAADGAALRLQGDNPLFVGQPVAADAPPLPGRYPLVLLSHGFGGNRDNQGWLAQALVAHGYMVAAATHPGTSTGSAFNAQSAALWQRPRDLSRLLDALQASPRWAPLLDGKRVAAIGHSLGGWTVMMSAGARFDPAQFDDDCRQHGELAVCRVYAALGSGRDAANRGQLQANWRDARIGAVVTLDLGLARGFTRSSLQQLPVPALVIAAGAPNPHLPAALESADMAAKLPAGTAYVVLPEAAHMSFLPYCKPGAAALLVGEPEDDRILCDDGEPGGRHAVHDKVTARVLAFLLQVWGGGQP